VKSVKVKVQDLLKSVRDNKKKHDKIFKKAMDGYWKKCRICITDALKAAKDEDPDWQQKMFPVNSAPEDHSSEYESAIRMLEMCADETIEITREEFNAYVLNQWNWRNTFLRTFMSYTGPTGPTGSAGDTGPTGDIDF